MSTTQHQSISYFELSPHCAVVPIEYRSLAYALEVRRAVFAYQPERVILEYPHAIEPAIEGAINRLPELSFVFYQTDSGQSFQLGVDPCDARVEAFRLAQAAGIEILFADELSAEPPEAHWVMPESWSVNEIGAGKLTELLVEHADVSPEVLFRRTGFLQNVSRANEDGIRTLVVCHASLIPALAKYVFEENEKHSAPHLSRVMTQLATSEHLPFLLGELPWLTHEYELHRLQKNDREIFSFDAALVRLIDVAAVHYFEEYDERLSMTDRRALFQFGRNLSLRRNRLRPGLQELITAAKGCGGDDFAAILLELSSIYPPLDDDASPLSEEHTSHHLYHDFGDGAQCLFPTYSEPNFETLEFKFNRRIFTQQQRDEWRDAYWQSSFGGICSWPPEDIAIEQFFQHLRMRALQQLSDEHTASEQFSTSIQDGLDVRETVRHWYDKKIYVKKERTPPGKVGPVVMVWKDLPISDPFAWRTTLYAENDNESDISFCATPLGQEVVGPQISRSDYHSILSIYPAMGIPDLWQIGELQRWKTSARLLTAAGILLSQERFVAVVGEHPPDAELQQFARDHGRALLFLPIQTFSRKTLRRLRQVHILSDKNARNWAADYIQDAQ